MTMIVLDKDGKLINVGPWEYQEEPEIVVGKAEVDVLLAVNPVTGEKYTMKETQDIQVRTGRMLQRNPMPEGARVAEGEVGFTEDGRAYVVSLKD